MPQTVCVLRSPNDDRLYLCINGKFETLVDIFHNKTHSIPKLFTFHEASKMQFKHFKQTGGRVRLIIEEHNA